MKMKSGSWFLGLWLLNACALPAADFPVWNSVDLTAALRRAQEGDRVLVHLGDYVGNWTVPAGVSLLGEPENPPRMPQPHLLQRGPGPILTVLTRAALKYPTQVRGLFFRDAQESALVVRGDGLGYLCGNSFERNHGERGGAIFATASGTLFIHTNYISMGTAKTDGGGICLAGAAKASLRKNEFLMNAADQDGGGLAVGGDNLVASDQDLFWQNRAVRDGGAVAIASNRQACLFDRAVWTENVAGRDGGGVRSDESALLILRGDSESCAAGRHGGFLAVRKGEVQMVSHRTRFSTAAEQGGGVYAEAAQFIAQNNQLEEGRARFGAGMSIREKPAAGGAGPLVSRNTFFNNRALKDGGGLYLAAVPEGRVEINVFFLNEAGKGSGALVAADAQATLANNTFAHIQYVSGLLPLPTGEAIYLRGANNASKVVNNLLAGHAYGVAGEANGRACVAGNDFYRTGLLDVPNPAAALNRFLWEPGFAQFNPRRQIGDFHLQANSPSCNAALPQEAPAVDRDGWRRDAQPDRGAYEFRAP